MEGSCFPCYVEMESAGAHCQPCEIVLLVLCRGLEKVFRSTLRSLVGASLPRMLCIAPAAVEPALSAMVAARGLSEIPSPSISTERKWFRCSPKSFGAGLPCHGESFGGRRDDFVSCQRLLSGALPPQTRGSRRYLSVPERNGPQLRPGCLPPAGESNGFRSTDLFARWTASSM